MATTKNRKVTLTNNDIGPRYAFTARGQEVVRSGDSLTTEMSDAQLDSLDDETIEGTDDAPRWTVETTDDDLDTGSDQGKALDKLTVAQLRSVANAEEVPLTGRTDPATGEALPDLTKKDDIVAAIMAHREAPPAA